MGDPTFLILLAAIVLMMWWMSRRNKKQRQAAESFRDSLTVGQEVMTGSGLFGVISEVDGDRITLVSGPAESTSVWLRAAIAKLVDPPVEEDVLADVEEDVLTDVEVPDDASELDASDAEPNDVEPDDDSASDDDKKNPYE